MIPDCNGRFRVRDINTTTVQITGFVVGSGSSVMPLPHVFGSFIRRVQQDKAAQHAVFEGRETHQQANELTVYEDLTLLRHTKIHKPKHSNNVIDAIRNRNRPTAKFHIASYPQKSHHSIR